MNEQQPATSLAEFVAGVTDNLIPASTRARAARVVADTLGVMLRGSVTADASRMIAGPHPEGASSIVAPGFPVTDAREAMLLNALSTCTAELDEGARPTGHPAMHVLPPLLAAAQRDQLSGTRFLTAFIVGYEAQARLQRAARLRTSVHCHGNLGNVGVAAGLAWMRGAAASQIAAAMQAAAAFASATSYSLPYSGATVHSAGPAITGMVASTVDRLVAAGYTANPGSVEEVFGSLLGDGFAADELDSSLGEHWAVETGYVKFHATCGHAHPIVEALIDATRRASAAPGALPWLLDTRFDPDSIARVVVWVSSRAVELDARPPLATSLAGRFSIPFVTATTLAHGRADIAAFERAALEDPRICALANRVEMRVDPNYAAVFPSRHLGRVEIHTVDGRILVGNCENPYGNAENPASNEHVKQKFEQLVGEVLEAETATALWARICGIDSEPNIRHLFRGFEHISRTI